MGASLLALAKSIYYIDSRQNIWFKGKDITQILGYTHTDKAIRNHVDDEDTKSYPSKTAGQVRHHFLISESGFYSLILSSKLESAKNSNIGSHHKYSRPSENMDSTDCLTIPITTCLK